LVATIHLKSRNEAKSLLEGTPSLKGPAHWLFSDGAIRVDAPTGTSHIEWQMYIRARETAAHFLLYSQTRIAHVIPKRCLATNEEVTRLREMVRHQVPSATLQSE
jgi:hypothetical protein